MSATLNWVSFVDVEAPQRRVVIARLASACECIEQAPVTLPRGDKGRVDVLCRPRDTTLACYCFTIEVKNFVRPDGTVRPVGDDDVAPWVKQCADYVEAMPDNGWPMIVAGFLWLVGATYKTGEDRDISAMITLAQQFRVGRAYDERGGKLVLAFGPSADIYRERSGGWTARASELLKCRRTSAGTRKHLRG